MGCAECVFAHTASCVRCKAGFVMSSTMSDDPRSSGSECLRCPHNRANCSRRGSKGCDACRPGFGYNAEAHQCQWCGVEHCQSCAVPRWPKCAKCDQGYGITSEGRCDGCGDFCQNCDQVGKCASCAPGYALRAGSCFSCADSCADCGFSGPAKCDSCLPGFYLDKVQRTCLP